MQWRNDVLRSRFGLRLLAVFVSCSLLPVLFFGTFAYLKAEEQLTAEAERALIQSAKSAGMSLFERLQIASEHLTALSGLSLASDHTMDKIFSSVSPFDAEMISLSDRQRSHLEENRTLLTLDRSPSSPALGLIRRAKDGTYVLGELRPTYLYIPERLGPDERYWVTNAKGDLLLPTGTQPGSRPSIRPLEYVDDRKAFEVDSPDGPELAVHWSLFLDSTFGSENLRIGYSRSRDSILRPLSEFKATFATTALLAILGSLIAALFQIRRRIDPLRQLEEVSGSLSLNDYSARTDIRSGDEFEKLGLTFNSMADQIERHILQLEQINRMGQNLLEQSDSTSVAWRLAEVASDVSDAEAVMVVFIRPEATSDPHSRYSSIGLLKNRRTMATDSFDIERILAQLGLVSGSKMLRRPLADEPAIEQWGRVEQACGKTLASLVAVPLSSSSDYAMPGFILTWLGEATDFSSNPAQLMRPLQLIGDHGSAVLQVLEHVASLRGLFEGLIQLTVEAIDQKSPHTGDHCRRVPILSEMVADAVCAANSGALKDFSLSREERYELKIAALLHDCGKVSTPVHVMDKATKLEAIMDRIELVRARAEIIRRDLEIGALKAIAERDPKSDFEWADESSRILHRLDADMAFLEHCNVGGEYMDPARQSRVDEILHHYNWIEESGESRSLISTVEAENLKISRGTLNDEERAIIEEHVVSTISLLEKLPFPQNLANVPAIAGAHHEHIDGTGYPNQLGGQQLSIQARILGLADIFEALTAKDRPYKPGKTLSETLEILDALVDKGHIDPDLYEIFLKSGLHHRYAIEHMSPEQIDEAHREACEELTAPWKIDVAVDGCPST